MAITVNRKEKALFRIGATVTCDYYPGATFKVRAKEWDHYGTITYTIVGAKYGEELHTGLRQKYLNKAK